MRIISKFHDYYDKIQMYGADRELIYYRNQLVIDKEPERYQDYYSFKPITIGFCGKLYFAYQRYILSEGDRTCWNMEDCDKSVKDYSSTNEAKIYLEGRGKFFKWKSKYETRGEVVRGFMEENRKNCSELREIFEQYNTPIFVEKPTKIIINACLKDYDFYRQLDAYNTYQEISMYVGNFLKKPTKEIPEIADDIMRDIKGFDKHSFRKEPTKKARRK